MNSNEEEFELPRIIRNPRTGEESIEFMKMVDKKPESVSTRVVTGVVCCDVKDGGTVIKSDAGVLSVYGNMIPTTHTYESLRDILYPVEAGTFS